MPTYFLRMEAVNISAVIQDTTDLSTIRGGGLMLLHAVNMIDQEFTSLQAISTGASSGLFSFEANDEEAAKILKKDIVTFLIHDDLFKYATFTVDITPSDGDFTESKERVMTMNRFRQFRQPTLVWPSPSTSTIGPCNIDGVRPAIKTGPEAMSASVAARREYGREQKQTFYNDELSKLIPPAERLNYPFTENLEQLTTGPTQGNLNGKMAVIYLDGNKFSKIQSGCKSPKSLKQWDSLVKDKRRGVLKTLLDGCIACGEDQIQLETLLWGGDELIWVVPAWRGWDVLQLFYKQTSDWSFANEEGTWNLTTAGGIVFCNHKANIHNIVKLSIDLANSAKDTLGKGEAFTPSGNTFQYITLESFDHINMGLSKYRALHLPEVDTFSLPGLQMDEIARAINNVKKTFPRNKVFDGIRDAKNSTSDLELYCKRLKQLLPSFVIENLKKLEKHLGPPPGCWMHLAELWDYIPEEAL